MTLWDEWVNRVRHVGRHLRFDQELDEEIRFHIDTRIEELRRSGLSSDEARTQARREFGSVIRTREESREAWRFGWLEDLAADLRYALRALRRSPGFTLTAVLSLGLGIGASSAIFGALDAAMWKPLPVADPSRLVHLSLTGPNGSGEALPSALVQYLRESDVFAGVGVAREDGLSFALDGRAERVVGDMVSSNFFALLGVPPILGQGFSAEVQAGRWAPEAVLSYNFWRERFGADPHVVGRVIRLNTHPFTVVGVSPPSFFGLTRGSDYELRIPILPDGQELPEIRLLRGSALRTTFARLKPGDTIAQAETRGNAAVQAFLRTTSIAGFRNAGFRHLRVLSAATGDAGDLRQFRAPLYVLLALVGVVFLIACVNVANLLLARGMARARELAIRASIGAGRGRLVRQMLAESLLLSLTGGALGLVIARGGNELLLRFLPQGHIRLLLDLRPDGRLLFFTFALSLVVSVLFGLVPGLHSTRGDLAATIKSDAAAAIGGRSSARFRKVLVSSQVAFSLMLLIASGVFVRTLADLRPAEYRQPERVLLFTMKPQQEIYSEARRTALSADLIRSVTAIPGVQAAALAENGPLGSRTDHKRVETPGHAPVEAAVDTVTRGFFDTIGMRLLAGRDFSSQDQPTSPLVAVVNRALTVALFAGRDPIGQHLGWSDDPKAQRFEIVGVVDDTHYYEIRTAPQPAVWFAMGQIPPYMPTLHVRTAASDTSAITAAVRREFDAVDKGFPVFNIRTLAARVEDSLSRERLVADLSAAFGAVALALTAVGLYGVLAYSVARRTREIGVRVALGCRPASVLWIIAREALALVGTGSFVGGAMAVIAARLLSSYLVGVSAIDAGTLTACALLMLLVAVAAVSIPARRACRVDPMTAFRCD
jgi:predicted permease